MENLLTVSLAAPVQVSIGATDQVLLAAPDTMQFFVKGKGMFQKV